MPHAQTLTLADSRLLSYDDLGDPGGVPVVFFHGVPGSRAYWSLTGPGDTAAEKAVRLVTFDRPGIGRSSPAPHRCVLDTAADVEQLADSLEIDRFCLLAFSGGTSYALATAARLPDRVASVGLVSPVSDLSVPSLLAGLDPMTRQGLNALCKAPAKAWRLPERMDAGKLLAVAAHRAWALLPASDRRALSLPRVEVAASRMLEEAARHGLEGVRLDVCMLGSPWGFELSEVRAPVDIHVGSVDPWSTAETTHWLRRGLGSPRIRTYQGNGHFTILVRCAGDVLDALVSSSGLAAPAMALAPGA